MTTSLQFTDRVPVQEIRRTNDGYLVGSAPVARTGIQVYAGHEVGRPDLATVRVFRPENEVFSDRAVKSYAYRPITVDHPSGAVTSQNWRDFAAGMTGGEVLRDGEFVRVPLTLMDQRAIDAYDAGQREISMGYDAEIEFTDGVSPDGEKYDAIQRNMRMNHLALVARARGGDQLRLGDNSQDGGKPMTEGTNRLRTVHLDGLPVETTDAGAQAIERLQKDLKAAQQQVTDAETNHREQLAAKDAELAARDAEVDKLKGQIMSDEELDRRVQARAELVSKAKAIHDADYAGKADSDIRKMAVVGALGDQAIEGRSDEYVQARFDILAEDAAAAAATDPVRRVARDTAPRGQTMVGGLSDSQRAYENRLQNGWKQQGGEA